MSFEISIFPDKVEVKPSTHPIHLVHNLSDHRVSFDASACLSDRVVAAPREPAYRLLGDDEVILPGDTYTFHLEKDAPLDAGADSWCRLGEFSPEIQAYRTPRSATFAWQAGATFGRRGSASPLRVRRKVS